MIYNIWLTKLPMIGCYTQNLLLEYFKTAENIYNACKLELISVPGIGEEKAQMIQTKKSLEYAEKILRDCEKCGIKIMDQSSEYYPDKLRKLPNMPSLLYYKGTPQEHERIVGVIGARRCTNEGKQKTVECVEQLMNEKAGIISGMAKGIDSYAHTICVNQGGYTIAVLGNGLDICYPPEHQNLYEKIAETGLLISEYEPGCPAMRYHFPMRNRIIAGMADEIIIPEKFEKSGANHTIDFAQKYGKKITFLS